MGSLLELQDLYAGTKERELLHGISMKFGEGETHVLLGPNGAGKSTLGAVIMGSPEYSVRSGRILFAGEDITALTPDSRAKRGIFLSFQNPVEVPGISLEDFLRNAIRQKTGKPIKIFEFKRTLEKNMEILQMDPSYADRDLNVGFSGGEKKKAEILQLLMLTPKFAILDETDSGLDVDAVRTVSRGIEQYQKSMNGTLLIITHSTRILESLHVDRTHVIVKGNLVAEGDSSLTDEISAHGFERFLPAEVEAGA